MGKLLKVGTLISANLLNNPLAYYSLINFNFLLSHTAHFDKRTIPPFLVFTTFGFLLSVLFLHFKQQDNIAFVYSLNFYLSLEFLIFPLI